MKEWETYVITIQYEEIVLKWRPIIRITQEEFTWTFEWLFKHIQSIIDEKKAEWIIVDILSIVQDFIH